jgi:hypothetical protein
MDEYYQNGPLPTWIGWYFQHLPHWFHVATAGATLAMELGIVFLMFLPRRARLICFFIVTPWEIVVILTANYTFLNYLVLVLGILLLDDGYLRRFVPARYRPAVPEPLPQIQQEPEHISILTPVQAHEEPEKASSLEALQPETRPQPPKLSHLQAIKFAVSAVLLSLVAYVTLAQLILMPFPDLPLPTSPIRALDPFRIANRYGLFAVMTRGRYEIEFQGSNDGQNWTAYPFRYKPQALNKAPGIYAPYQPRFDWNLWFASLADWQQSDIVPRTEERLLTNSRDVLNLFAGNPFPSAPPKFIRAVLWQYWFTTMKQKRETGDWWRREFVGLYAPVLTVQANGKLGVVEWPQPLPPAHD